MVEVYILFPAMYFFAEGKNRTHRDKKILLLILMTIIGSLLYGLLFPRHLLLIEKAIGRLVSFEIGYFLSIYIQEERGINISHLIIYSTCFLSCIILDKQFNEVSIKMLISRWRNCFEAIILIILFCLFLEKLKFHSIIRVTLRWFGQYTLELYLLHITIRSIFDICGLKTGYLLNYGFVLLITFLILPFFKHICIRCQNYLNNNTLIK